MSKEQRLWWEEDKKRLLVLGGGISGIGTAILGKQKGYEVLVSDAGNISKENKEVLKNIEVDWEEGGHIKALDWSPSLVMKSPGIPEKVALVQDFLKHGVAVISEIEFAAHFSPATIIAITGSNGKTTTTMLTHHLLQAGEKKAALAGNIGESFAGIVAKENPEVYALEVSSFQLDGIIHFKPKVAVITNITPDHLDRYDYKFENYVASKFRIAMNQTKEDYLIYDADDPVIMDWLQKHPVNSQLIPFSLQKKQEIGAYLDNEKLIFKTEPNNELSMSVDFLPIEGKHNQKNTMSATLANMLVRVRKESIRESIQNFQGAPHRLEKTYKINHVQYINDSKATNVNATYYALECVQRPIVWIAGGVDKGNDYSELLPMVREKVKAIICLGMDNEKLFNTFGNVVEPMVEVFSMEEAVKVAYKIAQRGDTVLLSPACASFDLFKNYEDRGDQFKAQVRKL